MPRNRVQHQKGLSDDAFERLYPDSRRAEKRGSPGAGLRASSVRGVRGQQYCEIRGRQLLQCRQCRYQTSLIAGTVLQGTKLPMRVVPRHASARPGQERAVQHRVGPATGDLDQCRLAVHHKLMQAMIEHSRSAVPVLRS